MLTKKTVDLRDKFEGHIVLWAKGWYGENTLERLYEIQREWCGMPADWTPFTKDTLRQLSETAEAVTFRPMATLSEYVTNYLFSDSRALTTYHVKPETELGVGGLMYALQSMIHGCDIDSNRQYVMLPRLLPNMQYRYELKDHY